jgi:hypothetical protein
LDALFADPRSFVTLLSLLANVGTAIYAWIAQRNSAKAKEIDDINAAIVGLDKRITKLEGDLQHLPDKDMVMEIKLALSELKGSVGQLGEKVAGVSHIVGVIDEAIRNGSMK